MKIYTVVSRVANDLTVASFLNMEEQLLEDTKAEVWDYCQKEIDEKFSLAEPEDALEELQKKGVTKIRNGQITIHTENIC